MKKTKKIAKLNKKVAKPRRQVGVPTKASGKNAFGVPYGDRVLVKPAAVEQQTSFGMILPDSGKEKPETGVVVAVGPGRRNEQGEVVPVAVRVGDTIMFSKYGYDEVKIGGEDYYLIREDSITFVF